MSHKLKLILLPLIALYLVSCSSIPFKTIYKVSTLDPMKINPNVLSVVLRIPNTFKEGENGVNLHLSSWLGESNTEPLKITLKKIKNKDSIKSYEQDGYDLFTYVIEDEDTEKLRRFRRNYRKQLSVNSNNINTKMAISSQLCRKKEIDDKPLLVSTWIKIDKSSGFLPTIVDFDVRKTLKIKEVNKKRCIFWGAVLESTE